MYQNYCFAVFWVLIIVKRYLSFQIEFFLFDPFPNFLLFKSPLCTNNFRFLPIHILRTLGAISSYSLVFLSSLLWLIQCFHHILLSQTNFCLMFFLPMFGTFNKFPLDKHHFHIYREQSKQHLLSFLLVVFLQWTQIL